MDYLNQNNFDTNAIFGETIKRINEIPYGQNFQGTTTTTTTTTTKATSSVPSLPNGYSKVSQGWGVTYNGATVYVCQLTDHSVSGSEYLGYEGGKWINLSYSEQRSGRYLDHLYKKSDNSIYFCYDTKLY